MISAATDARLRQFLQLALATYERVCQTYTITQELLAAGIPGDLVECGVFAGTQLAAMAEALLAVDDPARRIHAYDSFQGIPKAGPMDGEDVVALVGRGDGTLRTSGIAACGADQVRGYLAGWGFPLDRFVFHEGWFEDTVAHKQPERIAFLRLDGDLYGSTLVCLEHLYPLLSPGGYCLVDDYAFDGCRRAVLEYFGGLPAGFVEPGGGAPVYWRK